MEKSIRKFINILISDTQAIDTEIEQLFHELDEITIRLNKVKRLNRQLQKNIMGYILTGVFYKLSQIGNKGKNKL